MLNPHGFSTSLCYADKQPYYQIFQFSVSRSIAIKTFREACLIFTKTSRGFFQNGTEELANHGTEPTRNVLQEHRPYFQQLQQYEIFGNCRSDVAWCGLLEASETCLEHAFVLAVQIEFCAPDSIFALISDLKKSYQSSVQSNKGSSVKKSHSNALRGDGQNGHHSETDCVPVTCTTHALRFQTQCAKYSGSRIRDDILSVWCSQVGNFQNSCGPNVDIWVHANANVNDCSTISRNKGFTDSLELLKTETQTASKNGSSGLNSHLKSNQANAARTLVFENACLDLELSNTFPELSFVQNTTSFPYEACLEYMLLRDRIQFRLSWDPKYYSISHARRLAAELCSDLEGAFDNGSAVDTLEQNGKSSPAPHPERGNAHFDINGFGRELNGVGHEKIKRHCYNSRHIKGEIETKVNGDVQLTSDDIENILSFNERVIPFAEETVPRLFSKSVNTNPCKMAIEAWDGQLSYLQLDDLSNRLACYIRTSMQCFDEPIVTCFSKSTWAIVTILAILKSGNHYVPVDPSHPPSRIRRVIEITKATQILSSPEHSSIFPGPNSSDVVIITEDFLRDLPKSKMEIGDCTSYNAKCVVLFTSGSTGSPKGVLLRHSAICTSLLDHGSMIGVDSNSRVLSFASFAFDAHLWDTWTCLFYGGTICIPSEEERMSSLQEFLFRAEITDALLTPSLSSLITPSSLPFFKRLIVGGESPSSNDIKSLGKFGALQVINAYGPTECSVISAMNTNLQVSDAKNIGRPVGGSCFIVDQDNVNTLLPVGEEGEIVISGNHLAECYLNDNEKSAQAFVLPSWPGWAPSERVYRTGDLGTLGKDGNLRISGRKDGLIKFYGVRIERGEVEHYITQLGLHGASPVVDLVHLNSGRQALVCFFVPEGFGASSYCVKLENNKELDSLAAEIRTRLRESLPQNWIPTNFMFLNRIPLNTSDKIDRARLKDMFTEENPGGTTKPSAKEAKLPTYQSTQNAKVIEHVKQAWNGVLRLDSSTLGSQSDFFTLGGSSVDAIKVIRDLRNRGYQISIADLLKNSQLEALVELCAGFSVDKQGIATTDLFDYDPKPFELL